MKTLKNLRSLNRDKLGKIIWSRRIRLERWWRLNRRYQGLPSGLSFETVNRLCIDHLGKPLKDVSYIHLSGWKASGAYRLILETAGGHIWQLVYKKAVYDQQELPALRGLSIRPGRPEYLVYKQANSALSEYLPQVYACQEIVPGSHYQYILEDVSQEYQVLKIYGGEEGVRKDNLLLALNELPRLHRTLREWSAGVDSNYLLSFGRQFSSSLLVYAQKNLESYFQETEDQTVQKILHRMSLISELFTQIEYQDQRSICVIHGDYHSGHIYVHKNHHDRIKLLDWEWTGFGMPYLDLATILPTQDPDHEKFGLAYYAKQNNHISYDEHWRLYNFYQLERALLNASYIASQQLESSRKTNWGAQFIQKSTTQVIRALEQLI